MPLASSYHSTSDGTKNEQGWIMELTVRIGCVTLRCVREHMTSFDHQHPLSMFVYLEHVCIPKLSPQRDFKRFQGALSSHAVSKLVQRTSCIDASSDLSVPKTSYPNIHMSKGRTGGSKA